MIAPLFPVRVYHADGTVCGLDRIWVFGSNTGGRHGKSSALVAAKYFGAVEGVGHGRTGQAYAIATRKQVSPTNNWIVTRTLEEIAIEVAEFVEYTHRNNDLEYMVTSIACGNAGYTPEQIAPMFREAVNCSFPLEWKKHLDLVDQRVFENHKKSM